MGEISPRTIIAVEAAVPTVAPGEPRRAIMARLGGKWSGTTVTAALRDLVERGRVHTEGPETARTFWRDA